MKLIHLLFVFILNYSFSAIAQNKEREIESLNASLAAYPIYIADKPVYYQFRNEDFGKIFICDLYFADKVIAHTTFNLKQIDRVEINLASAGNYVITIISNDGKMKFHSILENKDKLTSHQTIALQASEEETRRVMNELENLFELN